MSLRTSLLRRWQEAFAQRFASDVWHALRAVLQGFRGQSINVHAGHLTFITLVGMVPLLTAVLALIQLLHQEAFTARITQFIQSLLAPGVQSESATFFERFINTASSRAAGGFSFVLLLVSATTLLRHLEAALNEIWAVHRRRNAFLSAGMHLLLLVAGPLVLAISLAGTAGVRDLLLALRLPFHAQVLQIGSAVLSVVGFSVIYKLAPHAPVRTRSAFAGGLIGGLLWEIAKQGYGEFAAAAFRQNPVYGSLSAVPLFLMWVYLSWWLLLFGARLAYAIEQAGFRFEFMDLGGHPRSKELVGAGVARLVTKARLLGEPPPTVKSAARALGVPQQLVQETVARLEKAALLSRDRRGELRPTREPAQLTLAELSAALGGTAKLVRTEEPLCKTPEFQQLERLFRQGDEAGTKALEQVTWSSLVDEENPLKSSASAAG